jgi:hypothetical protein
MSDNKGTTLMQVRWDMQLKIQPNRESIGLKIIIICCNLHTGHTTTAEKEQSRAAKSSSYLMRTRRRRLLVKIRFLRAPNSTGSMDPTSGQLK